MPSGSRPSPKVSNSQRRREQQAARARRWRWLIGAGGLGGAAGLVLLLALSHGQGSPPSTSVDPQAWRLPRLSGAGTVQLADYRGTPTVVNFFASWCTECRGELPGFARVSGELRGRVQFVGVNSLDNGNGAAMAGELGVSWWPIARDTGGQDGSALHDALDAQGMPFTAFYGADGKLVDTQIGAMSESVLRGKLARLYGVE